MKTIAIGADDAAYAFRDAIVAYLNGLGINVADYSSDKRQGSTVYPDVAHAVAMSIKQGEHERGILICGTGIGMSIVANKVPGSAPHSVTIPSPPSERVKVTTRRLLPLARG
ncbi:ribose 5-phosphate isomerase B [Klebsiella pneumoniae subsp. ozaenae]|uniref:Ribose 5-phosphate isomerase B n=1 Tax=Klebsiella pneumoniae subsp. ozaenae TaxID=574 RepID=A0A377ZWI3_KLEPO|nr:ribose 5-phosphate isomerase B [Klebsiella pneumoniae subsp. ozaenae]